MQEPYLEERSQEKGNARREFDARALTLPRGKIAQRPFVKQLRVAGRSSEDREGVDGGGGGPPRKMLRRQRRDFGGAGGEDSKPACLAGTKSRHHCRKSPSSTRENDEGQG